MIIYFKTSLLLSSLQSDAVPKHFPMHFSSGAKCTLQGQLYHCCLLYRKVRQEITCNLDIVYTCMYIHCIYNVYMYNVYMHIHCMYNMYKHVYVWVVTVCMCIYLPETHYNSGFVSHINNSLITRSCYNEFIFFRWTSCGVHNPGYVIAVCHYEVY